MQDTSEPIAQITSSEMNAGDDELRQRIADLRAVAQLHDSDPVTALELWKATRFNDAVVKNRTAAISDRRSSPAALQRTAEAPAADVPDPRMRHRRASHYPERVLVSMDPGAACDSTAEMQRRIAAVKRESRMFETDIARWRAAIDKDAAPVDVSEVTRLHQLEEQILKAKCDDLRSSIAEFEQQKLKQQQKLELLAKHVTKVCGDDAAADIPRIATAADLLREIHETETAIREAKYRREQKQQQFERQLVRAARKVETLDATLSEKQTAALLADTPMQLQRNATLKMERAAARAAKASATAAEAALRRTCECESEQRDLIEAAWKSATKVLRSDFQIALLALRPNVAAQDGAPFAPHVAVAAASHRKRGGVRT